MNVREFERHAQLMLSKNAFDYYASGANDMVTLRENRWVDTPHIQHSIHVQTIRRRLWWCRRACYRQR